MSVYKQPNSAHWLIEVQVGGRRFRRSSRTTSKRQAQALERVWRTDLEALPSITAPLPLALDDALDRYFSTVLQPRSSRRAASDNRYLLNRIREDLGRSTP